VSLPATKTPEELQRLSKDELFAYFEDHARFVDGAPNRKNRYAIRFGSKTLRDGDTYDLRKKFERAVKEAKPKAAKHGVTILDIRGGECFKTGHGAVGVNYAETKRLFEQAKRCEVPQARATFLVDMHDSKGDLVDSVLIDSRGFRKLTGEAVPTRAETRRYDREYWARARAVVTKLREAHTGAR